MLRVTIDLLPFGFDSPEYTRPLGRIDISNDGTGDKQIGNYKYNVWLVAWDDNGVTRLDGLGSGEITGFERKREAVELLALVMADWGANGRKENCFGRFGMDGVD